VRGGKRQHPAIFGATKREYREKESLQRGVPTRLSIEFHWEVMNAGVMNAVAREGLRGMEATLIFFAEHHKLEGE